jgi:hypothetical protein
MLQPKLLPTSSIYNFITFIVIPYTSYILSNTILKFRFRETRHATLMWTNHWSQQILIIKFMIETLYLQLLKCVSKLMLKSRKIVAREHGIVARFWVCFWEAVTRKIVPRCRGHVTWWKRGMMQEQHGTTHKIRSSIVLLYQLHCGTL